MYLQSTQLLYTFKAFRQKRYRNVFCRFFENIFTNVSIYLYKAAYLLIDEILEIEKYL